jgi:hypothetical protein
MICLDKAPRLSAGRSTSFRHLDGRGDRQVPQTVRRRHNPSTARHSDALCEDQCIPALRLIRKTSVAKGTAGFNMARRFRHVPHTEPLHLPTLHHSER